MAGARPTTVCSVLALSAGLAVVLLGCGAVEPLPDTRGGIEVGLRRGAAWSTVTVKPPYVIGPRVNLRLSRGLFTGAIDQGAVNLRADAQGLEGMGPAGQVAVDIEEHPDKLVIQGSWNGSRVHFEVTAASLRGTIALTHGAGLQDVFSCQYVLDKVEATGARTGSSICGGLPEETRLEVPRALGAWLTRQEMVVVLLALLSSPPFTKLETM
jgi:hypothetical protein